MVGPHVVILPKTVIADETIVNLSDIEILKNGTGTFSG